MQLNKYQERIIEIGQTKSAKLVLPERDDPRVSLAKRHLRDLGYELLEPEDFRGKETQYQEVLEQERFFKKMTDEAKEEYMKDTLNFSMMMVSNGDADGLVAGSITSTSNVLHAAIRIVGVKPKSKWVSSSFFMISPNADTAYTFADCAVIPEPTSDQLASIAGESAALHYLLTGKEPRVAFLSFSTKGSANHRRVSHVREAISIFQTILVHQSKAQV